MHNKTTEKEKNQKSGMNNPTLSLCMIVKDEEESLPTCLESIRGYVDEIIIIDTGSTDNTVKIAESFNAKVYHHPWENSFSKARNYSLKYATCDWILIMDADEEIEVKDAYKLKETIRDDNVNIIYMPAFSKEKGGTNSSVYLIERVFKNNLDFHYDGIVHNTLKFSGPCKSENIVFYHYGYHLDNEQMEKKFIRTTSLLKEQIKEDSTNPMPHHFLAVAFCGRNMNDECIDEALKAIRLFEHNNVNTNVKLLTCYTASIAFYSKNDLVNAEYYATKSVNSYSEYLDGYFMLSSIYMRQKEYDKCIKATNKYLTILETIKSNPSGVLQIPYNNINTAWHAHTRLAIVCFEQNRDREGIQKLEEIVSIVDDENDPYLSIGKYFIEQNNFALAEKILHIGLKEYPQSKRILYYISELYENHNIIDKALKYFKILLDIYPNEISTQYRIGIIHMKLGQYEIAIDIFKLLCSGPQENIAALYNMGIAYEQINDIPHAKETYERLLTIEPKNTETLVRLGSLFLNDSEFDNAKKCFLETIELGMYLVEAHLAMSRIYISQNDIESCIVSCDQLLKFLELPRDITINNLTDLSMLYIDIGKTLLRQQKEILSGFSFDIARLLDPVVHKSNDLQSVVTVHNSTEEFQNSDFKVEAREDNMSTRETNLKFPAQTTERIIPEQTSTHNPTLSLCMIVKDEEKFLPTCLESVKDHVDEIIIVDTGSTDSTVEIARKYTTKIYHHPWENSFSKARNYSLSYATSDWILILDADEELEREDACKLREVINDNEVNVINLPVYYKPKGGKNLSVSSSERIFRNHVDIHYEGIVHNALKYSGSNKSTNIRLYHYGYHEGNEQMEKKFKRTSDLLMKQIKDDPENPLPHHYLAISCLDRNRNDECIEEALEAIRLFELQNSDEQMRLLCYFTACVAFYRKQDLDNAEKYALKAINFYSDYLDAHCILSSIYFLRKEYDKCEKATENYLRTLKSLQSDPSQAMLIPFNTINHAWLAHTRMAINHYEQGNQNCGHQALNNAINCAEGAWEPYFVIGKHFAEHNNLKMAGRFLHDGLKHDPGNKEIQYFLASTYERSGGTEKAIACLKQILDYHPEEVRAQYNLGLLLLKANKPDEAIKSFKSVINKEPKHFDALLNMAIAYEETGNIAQSKDTYNTLTTINHNNAEVLLRLGSIYLRENDNIRAKECFLKLVNSEEYLIEAHLGLSKAYLSINDPENCIRSCDELLKHLKLPRNITINSLSDLSDLYIQIGIALLKEHKEHQVKFSFEIAELLNPGVLDKVQHKTADSAVAD